MIHAYQETYLNKAQTTLGEAFDYAFNDCGISIKDLNSIIVNSEIIFRFEQGDPAIIAGKSGPEIIIDIFYQAKNEYIKKTPEIKYSRSAEYWIGWIIAYYQWYSDRKISEILEAVSFEELRNMYYTLHEADISKTVEILDEKLKKLGGAKYDFSFNSELVSIDKGKFLELLEKEVGSENIIKVIKNISKKDKILSIEKAKEWIQTACTLKDFVSMISELKQFFS